MSILTRVQSNPDIGTDNAAYVNELITRAKNFIVKFCNLPRFPELSQGYSISGTNASTDLTGLSTNSFYLSANSSPAFHISLTLANCDTGSNIAAELQTQIQSASSDYGFDEITVTFDSENSQYTITSGRYGENSWINFSFLESEKHVCKALKLTCDFGGKSFTGALDNDALTDACVKLVESNYRRIGTEGMQSISISGAMSANFQDIDKEVESVLLAHRRFF